MTGEIDGGGTIDSRPVHSGRVVHLSIDRVRYPDGSIGELEMIRHSGAAAVLPVLDPIDVTDPRVLLVHQYRYAGGGYLYEVPAGRPDRPGEDWAECARRELAEETGYLAASLLPLTSILTTPGFTDEIIHIFMATGLECGSTGRDDDEFMEVVEFPLSAVLRMIRSGEIRDSKTICSILYFQEFIRGPGRESMVSHSAP